jgi:hypothetical protein
MNLAETISRQPAAARPDQRRAMPIEFVFAAKSEIALQCPRTIWRLSNRLQARRQAHASPVEPVQGRPASLIGGQNRRFSPPPFPARKEETP